MINDDKASSDYHHDVHHPSIISHRNMSASNTHHPQWPRTVIYF